MRVVITPYPPAPTSIAGHVRELSRELRGTHDALGKPQRVLGVAMRGVPVHRREHRWALVREVRGQLWRLAARRRRGVVVAGIALACVAYTGVLVLHDGTPDGVVAGLGVAGLLGIVGACLGMTVNATPEVRRICVLSHGVCAGCLGRLTRSCASGLATCEDCGAAWDGREVFEGHREMHRLCARCDGVCDAASAKGSLCGACGGGAMMAG